LELTSPSHSLNFHHLKFKAFLPHESTFQNLIRIAVAGVINHDVNSVDIYRVWWEFKICPTPVDPLIVNRRTSIQLGLNGGGEEQRPRADSAGIGTHGPWERGEKEKG